MTIINTGLGTVLGAALLKGGVYVHHRSADHGERWMKQPTSAKLHSHFFDLFIKTEINEVVIVVDKDGKQYIVKDMDELQCVWRQGEIAYCVTMSNEVFNELANDTSVHAVPPHVPV